MSDLSKTVSLDSLIDQKLDGRVTDFEGAHPSHAEGKGGGGKGRGGGKGACRSAGGQKGQLREKLLAEAQVVACTLSGSGMDASAASGMPSPRIPSIPSKSADAQCLMQPNLVFA